MGERAGVGNGVLSCWFQLLGAHSGCHFASDVHNTNEDFMNAEVHTPRTQDGVY